MVDFPVGVTVTVTGLRYSYEERYHPDLGLCSGPGCGVCSRYKGLWAESERVSGQQQEAIRNEARDLKPLSRFYYGSDQGAFSVGKFLHQEFEVKGPNVKVRKSMVSSGWGHNKREFAKYEVVTI